MSANPTLASVKYQPGNLSLMWNPDGGSAFSVLITDTTAGTSNAYAAAGFSANLHVTLEPATDAWTVAVACTDGGVTGPYSAAVPILTLSPALTALLNQTTQIVAAWTGPAGYAGGYAATLANGQSGQTITTDDLTVTFLLQQAPTGDQTGVYVQLHQEIGSGSTLVTLDGPSVGLAVITATCALISVDYSSGVDLVLTWAPPAGYQTFQAFLQSSAAGTSSLNVAGDTCSFAGPLVDAAYTVSVAAASPDFVSIGPPCAGVQALTEAPVMTSVYYNGAQLALAWQALAGGTGYQAVLQVPEQQAQTLSVISTTCDFPGVLDVAGCTCWVSGTASGGVVVGPPSPVYTVLMDRPLWVLGAYDSGQLSLTWTPVAESTVSGYLLTFYDGTSQPYAYGDVTSATLSLTLLPSGSYYVMVAATNGIVRGPDSPALVPLTAPPLNPFLGYTGAALRLTWLPSGQSNVTGYSVELQSDGVLSESTQPTASPQLFATPFASAVVYTARARCSGPGTLGPWCATVTGPYQAEIAYGFDALGRLASVAWGGGFTEAYAFDSAGNLQTVAYTAAPTPQDQGE